MTTFILNPRWKDAGILPCIIRERLILPGWKFIIQGLSTLVGQYVGSGGSARPISKVNFDGVKLSFAIPPQWDPSPNDLVFEAVFQGDSLSGTVFRIQRKKIIH